MKTNSALGPLIKRVPCKDIIQLFHMLISSKSTGKTIMKMINKKKKISKLRKEQHRELDTDPVQP